MPNNQVGSPQDRPTPRDYNPGGEPLRVVRILDGHSRYSHRYGADEDGEEGFTSRYNAHEPEAEDDSLGLY